MNSVTEFAPEHSTAYRVRFVVLGCVSGACVVVASKLWLFHALSAFARTAHCREVFGIPGPSVLAYGLFVGMPLFMALVVAGAMGFRGAKILSSGQVPPPGEKVFKKTPIRRGRRAQLVGSLHLLACTPLIAISIWGYPAAAEFSANLQRKAVDPSVEATHCAKLQFAPHLER